ncbi:MAG: hypothetical protein KatS3mg069_0728 [Meiothermus sp.]|nr:MAG: hypothetical protein KatS3mg069_0728 [Meiothermus sp.]
MVFKVTLNDALRARNKPFRVIAIRPEDSLFHLAEAIVESFDFDFDHTFTFLDNIKNPYASKVQYEYTGDLGDELGEEGLDPAELAYEDALEEANEVLTERLYQATVQIMKEEILPRVPPHLQEKVAEIIEKEQRLAEQAAGFENELLKLLNPYPTPPDAKFGDVRKVSVGQAFETPGQKMLLLYDYDDEWPFVVEYMRQEEASSTLEYPLLLQSVGRAPDQYGDF